MQTGVTPGAVAPASSPLDQTLEAAMGALRQAETVLLAPLGSNVSTAIPLLERCAATAAEAQAAIEAAGTASPWQANAAKELSAGGRRVEALLRQAILIRRGWAEVLSWSAGYGADGVRLQARGKGTIEVKA